MGRRKKKDERIEKRMLWILIAVLTVAVIAYGLMRYTAYYEPNTRKAAVEISSKDNYEQAMDAISNSKVTVNFNSFRRAAGMSGLKRYLKPGHYEIKGGLTNKALIRIFANGWQSPVNVVVTPYMRSLQRIASKFSAKMDADSAEILKVLQDGALRDSLGFSEASYLSLFIPDTYQIYWTDSPKSLLLKIKKNYDKFWNDDRMARVHQIGLSRDEVVTLASIVCEESKYAPELPSIAGVYMNRLRIGMPLQADPTVLFVIGDPRPTRVLKSYLQIDSPYNTYKYKGLPPGPITTVPAECIDAVLNYESSNYLYFCAKPTFDGSHNFASSYSQHQKNALLYQKALDARTAVKN
jgi:UPF0755 protein